MIKGVVVLWFPLSNVSDQKFIKSYLREKNFLIDFNQMLCYFEESRIKNN